MALRRILTRITQREKHDYKKVFRDSFSPIRSLQKPSELFTRVTETLRRLFNAQGAALLLRDETTGQFVLKAAVIRSPLSYCIPIDHPFLKKLAQWGRPLQKEEMTGEALFSDLRSAALRLYMELQAEILVPLIRPRADHASGLFGLISLGRREVDYDEEDRDLLLLLSQEITISIENAFLYEEILRQNTRLKELSQLKNGFLASTTHELTTPLHNIIGLAQAMAEGIDGPVTEGQKGHLQMVREAGQRLLGIIETILNISSIEKTSREMPIKKMDLARLLNEVLLSLKPQMKERGIRWFQKLQSTWVYGDEELISDLLRRILENAVQHTERGTIEVRTEKAGEMVKFCVKDTGRGIFPEDRQKIFEEFGQAGETLQRGGAAGAGLGLAVAKKIVELHGGRIWVESQVGFGSEFYFTLPRKPSLIRSQAIS